MPADDDDDDKNGSIAYRQMKCAFSIAANGEQEVTCMSLFGNQLGITPPKRCRKPTCEKNRYQIHAQPR